MLELLSNRRSIRKFTDQAVSDEHLEKLLMAGLLAPSSKDTRPVELVAVRDKAVIAALADCRDSGTMPLRTAPWCWRWWLIPTNRTYGLKMPPLLPFWCNWKWNALGLGSTWVQMRLRTNGAASAEAEVRKTLGIPGHYGVLCLVAIGHKDEVKKSRELDASDWARTHRDYF